MLRVSPVFLRKQLEELEKSNMLRGELSTTQQLALLSSSEDLAQALDGAFFVQVSQQTAEKKTSLCVFVAGRPDLLCKLLLWNLGTLKPSEVNSIQQ